LASSNLVGIQSSQIDEVWPQVIGLMRGVLKEEPDYSHDHIKYYCKQAKMQLWVTQNIDGFVVTEIQIYPLRKVLVAMFAGGKDGKVNWIEVMEDLKKFAKDTGCASVRIYGRRGWVKKFKPQKEMSFFDTEVL